MSWMCFLISVSAAMSCATGSPSRLGHDAVDEVVGDLPEGVPVRGVLPVHHRQPHERVQRGVQGQQTAAERLALARLRADQDRDPQQQQGDLAAPLIEPERGGLPDRAPLAVQQRRPACGDGQRVTVGHPQRVAAVAGLVPGQVHLRGGHVQAGGQVVLGLDRGVEPGAVRQDHLHAGAFPVPGHRRLELDLLAGLVGVAEPGGVVGAQHHVGVEHPEPGHGRGRGDDRPVLGPPRAGQRGQHHGDDGQPAPPRREPHQGQQGQQQRERLPGQHDAADPAGVLGLAVQLHPFARVGVGDRVGAQEVLLRQPPPGELAAREPEHPGHARRPPQAAGSGARGCRGSWPGGRTGGRAGPGPRRSRPGCAGARG